MGTLTFGNAGNASAMDQAWTVGGVAHLRTDGSNAIMDLQGGSLVATGALRVACPALTQTSSGGAVITNGLVTIGTASAGGNLSVALFSGTAHYQGYAAGSLTFTKGTALEASYLKDVYVGRGDTNSAHPTAQIIGTLDLQNATITNGLWRCSKLVMGDGRPPAGSRDEGRVKLGQTNGLTDLVVLSLLGIGGSESGSGYGRMGVEANGWLLPSNVNLQVGQDAGSRGDLRVGLGRWEAADGYLAAATGGVFTAYLGNLWVGSTLGGYNVGGTGILDLRRMNGMTGDVNNVRIGDNDQGGAASGVGQVYLPPGIATVRSNVTVGAPSLSQGLLELFGTLMPVGGRVTIGATGRVTNHVQGVSCGLDVASSDTNDFTVASAGRVHLAFEANPATAMAPYWGLRMAGNQVAYFADLTAAGRITYSTAGLSPSHATRFGIFHDSAAARTYIGLLPVRGTVFLVH